MIKAKLVTNHLQFKKTERTSLCILLHKPTWQIRLQHWITQSFGSEEKNAWIVSDDTINHIFDWNKTIGTYGLDNYKNITLDDTGSFYAVIRGVQSEDVMLTQYDRAGETIWNKYYGDTLPDYANDVLWLSDSSVVFTEASYVNDSSKTFTTKINNADTVIWFENWDNAKLTEGKSVIERQDRNLWFFSSQCTPSIGYNSSGKIDSLENGYASKIIIDSHEKNLMLGYTEDGNYNTQNFHPITDNTYVLQVNTLEPKDQFNIYKKDTNLFIESRSLKDKSFMIQIIALIDSQSYFKIIL